MLISHRKRFIFIKTLKTAGTSVEVYFEKWCMPEGEWTGQHSRAEYESETGIIGYRGPLAYTKKWQNHMPAKEVKAHISSDVWNNYFKFTTVRNPYDKLISEFYFKKFKFDEGVLKNDFFFAQNLFDSKNNKATIETFQKWVREKKFAIDTDKFYEDGIDYMDYYIRYENLNEGIEYVCNKLDIPFEADKIPRLKSGIRNVAVPITEFYDNECIEIVYNAFPWEFKKFNYQFPR